MALSMNSPHGPLRVGIGGPVGSGKTALMDALCKRMRGAYKIAAITKAAGLQQITHHPVLTYAAPDMGGVMLFTDNVHVIDPTALNNEKYQTAWQNLISA